MKIQPIFVFPCVRGPRLAGSGKSAFKNCTDLEEIFVPNDVKRIGNGAFQGCTNLKDVSLPNGIHRGEDVFTGCNIENLEYRKNNAI